MLGTVISPIRACREASGIDEPVGRRRVASLLVGLLLLGGCKGHTGGMTPGRGLARAAGAIATVAAASVASAATRRRDRSGESSWSDPSSSDPPELRWEPTVGGEAPLRLVQMPTGEAALAPEQIVCEETRECVAIATNDCQPVAILARHASERVVPSCEPPSTERYEPRCIHALCRLVSWTPAEIEGRRARVVEEGAAVGAGDVDTEVDADALPLPPPGYR